MKPLRILSLFALALPGLIGCLPPSGGGGTDAEGFSGRFVDSQGRPVRDALVKVYRLEDTGLAKRAAEASSSDSLDSARTDEKGRFNFPDLENGRFNMEGAGLQGGDSLAVFLAGVEVKGPKDLGDIALIPPGSVRLTVFTDGAPQEGAFCYVPGSSYFSISDDSGSCLISGIPSGKYPIRIRYPNLLTQTLPEIEVNSGKEADAGIATMENDPLGSPPSPKGVTATFDSASGSVTVRWNAVKVSDLQGYLVFRRKSQSAIPEQLTPEPIPDSSFADSVIRLHWSDSAVTYVYQVKSLDSNSNLSLAYSDPARVTVSASQFPLSAGLVGYWPFSRNAEDLSSQGNHGAARNGARYGTDRRGDSAAALELDGVDDYVDVGGGTSLNPSVLTVAAWVYPMSARRQTILGRSSFTADLDASYALSLGLRDSINNREPWLSVKTIQSCGSHVDHTRVGAEAIPLNSWTFVVGTWDGTTMRLYVNGELTGTQIGAPTGGIVRCPAGQLRIGVWWTADPMYFHGKIDDVRIYDRALSAPEVAALYAK